MVSKLEVKLSSPVRQQILQPWGTIHQWIGLKEKGYRGGKIVPNLTWSCFRRSVWHMAEGRGLSSLHALLSPCHLQSWKPQSCATHRPHTPHSRSMAVRVAKGRLSCSSIPLHGEADPQKIKEVGRTSVKAQQQKWYEVTWQRIDIFFQMLTSIGSSSQGIWYFTGCFPEVLTGLLRGQPGRDKKELLLLLQGMASSQGPWVK